MRANIMVASLLLCCMAVSTYAVSDNDPNDPHQDFNRHMFALNDSLDKTIFKPVATLYQTVLPSVARKGVTHFFSNLDEIPTVVNDTLQGNGHYIAHDSTRFLMNSTLGVGGLFDVAADVGLQKHSQDFGLTMAKWGYKDSSYLVLPLLGPSTVRDTLGLPVDYFASVYPYLDQSTSLTLYSIEVINTRANLLSYGGVYAQAFDPYVFVRNAYLQRRNRKIEQDTLNDSRQS